VAFSASVVADQLGVPGLDEQGSLLAEDACKFLGVLAWAQYFTLTSADIAASIVNELRNTGAGGDGELDEALEREAAVAVASPTA